MGDNLYENFGWDVDDGFGHEEDYGFGEVDEYSDLDAPLTHTPHTATATPYIDRAFDLIDPGNKLDFGTIGLRYNRMVLPQALAVESTINPCLPMRYGFPTRHWRVVEFARVTAVHSFLHCEYPNHGVHNWFSEGLDTRRRLGIYAPFLFIAKLHDKNPAAFVSTYVRSERNRQRLAKQAVMAAAASGAAGRQDKERRRKTAQKARRKAARKKTARR